MTTGIDANTSVQTALSPTREDHFLRELGERVRAARSLRGMTRKAVAKQADVSERHLAQLEAGEGNISVLLLRRIAAALHVSLSELFEENARRKRIALIGIRGAGKSTLGKKLAQEFGIPFVELDQEIEKETGMPLAEIFSLYGQAGYRAIEKRTLERVLREYDRGVISVGGGAVSEQETYEQLLAGCYTVWIKAQPEEYMARIIEQGDFRPMAGNDRAMEDLRRILETREPLYRMADLSIDTSGSSVEESFAKLKNALQAQIE